MNQIWSETTTNMNGTFLFFIFLKREVAKGYVSHAAIPLRQTKQSKDGIPLREHPKSGHLARPRGQGPQTKGVGKKQKRYPKTKKNQKKKEKKEKK